MLITSLGIHPLPYIVYAAAKAAIHGLAVAVSRIGISGIDVNVAVLGPTKSEFWENLGR